jgi:hypothetical protein
MEPEFLAIINSWRATLDDTEIALLRGMREERERGLAGARHQRLAHLAVEL